MTCNQSLMTPTLTLLAQKDDHTKAFSPLGAVLDQLPEYSAAADRLLVPHRQFQAQASHP